MQVKSTGDSQTNWTFDSAANTVLKLDASDEVSFVYHRFEIASTSTQFRQAYNFDIALDTDTQVYNTSNPSTIEDQESVDFGYFFDQGHTQKDFVLSLVRMFNLYIEQLDDGTLRFVPRDEFYDGSNVDWSQKLDYSQAHEILSNLIFATSKQSFVLCWG